ncbi:MAG: hypothetical protein LBH98_08475, partial [Chitinispirillales bacterium]|nr:hypothetical protein [Chitinispirillales bacterium]
KIFFLFFFNAGGRVPPQIAGKIKYKMGGAPPPPPPPPISLCFSGAYVYLSNIIFRYYITVFRKVSFTIIYSLSYSLQKIVFVNKFYSSFKGIDANRRIRQEGEVL